MIYTLTLNPALDYDMYLNNDIVPGAINASIAVNTRAGGKGINVSKLLRTLHQDSVALGFVGGFVGDYIIRDLESNCIKHDFIHLQGNTRINVKINANSNETELMGLSPIISNDDVSLLFEKISNLTSDDILVLSGSCPKSLSTEIYLEISKKCKQGTKIVLDTRGNILKQNIHNNFLIKPNIHELEEMFHQKLSTKESIVEKCHYFLQSGVENIIVSRGGDGALFINKDCILEAEVPNGKLVNSVGAGDSMVAGFIAGYTNHYSIEDCFKLACASGSATAYSLGLGEKDLIDDLFNKITIK